MNFGELNSDLAAYYEALGACGLEILTQEPFEPFIAIFDQWAEAVDTPQCERFVRYEIFDPRAVDIRHDEDDYYIGLAPNEEKGVKDAYPARCIHQIITAYVSPPDYPEQWFRWGYSDQYGSA